MAMAQATLSTQLQNLAPTSTEAEAITNLVNAYGTFASGAEALTPILAAGVNLGKSAMTSALSGMSASGQGATKIKAGIVAFWGAVAGGLTTSFSGATAITPPPHSSLLSDLQDDFDDNTSGSVSLVDAVDAIATTLRNAAVVGGTVTTAGPIVTPIT